MPEKVLPTPEEFAEFDRRMRARGFRWMTREEKRRSMAHIRKPPPRKRKGAQVGYIYQNPATEHEVWVWSTWVWEDNAAREVGMAWVLIIKTGRKSLRQAEPYLRTENFLTTLRWAAACAKWRVDHRHPCPLCGNPMDIIYGNKYKEREWRCRNQKRHAGPVYLSWDYGVPPEIIEFERPRREDRARQLEKLRKEGKEPGGAVPRRKRWE